MPNQGDISQKVARGQVLPGLPADEWNRHVETSNIVLGRGQAPPQEEQTEGGSVNVKNVSGQVLPRGSILGINGFRFDPSLNSAAYDSGGYALNGATPSMPDHMAQFVITEERIDVNQYGLCKVEGRTTCTVLMHELTHQYAVPIDGSTTQLESTGTPGGVLILAKENVVQGNPARCLVRFVGTGGQSIVGFELTEDMGATTPNEASGKILDLRGTDTGNTSTFLDPFAIFNTLTNGLKGFAVADGDAYVILQAECP